MRKIVFFVFSAILVVYFLSSAGLALAKGDDGPAKIGLINIQKIIMESNAGKDARAAFEKELEGRRSVLQVKEKEVKALEAELKNLPAGTKAETRKAKEGKFSGELKELKRLGQDLEEELKKKDSELTSKVLKEIYKVTSKMGEEQGYAVIMLMSSQTIYVAKASDITDEVIKNYNSQYTKR